MVGVAVEKIEMIVQSEDPLEQGHGDPAQETWKCKAVQAVR
jgi:hypothetical protein